MMPLSLKKQGMVLIVAAAVVAQAAPAYAARSEFEEMRRLQAQEKVTQPAKPVVPTVEYKSKDARDPFLACVKREVTSAKPGSQPQSETITAPQLVIQGVVWGGRVSQAIINGKVLTVGGTVEGATITAITAEGIDIVYKDKPFHIPSPSSMHRNRNPQTTQGGFDAQKP